MKHGYKVVIDVVCVDSWREEDVEWGSWSAESEHSIVSISREDNYPDIASSLDIGVGEECYVVWAEWGSGDSFGHHTGCYAEAFGIFKTKQHAEEFAQVLKDADKADDYGKLSFKSADGQLFDFPYLPYCGYFECLERVEVSELIMGEQE